MPIPLTLSDIRAFSGTDRVLLDSQGGLQSVNKGQRFKSFINFGDARQKNLDTYNAIRDAILNDPRYFAHDVQEMAEKLLGAVRTDRAISAVQIRGIVDQLDAMSTDSLRLGAARQLAGVHVAGRGIPEFARDFAAAYKTVAERTITDPEPAGGYGKMDFGAAIDAFEHRVEDLLTRMGDAPGDREMLGAKFLDYFGKYGLPDQGECEALVDKLKANLDESRAAGARHGEPTRQIVLDVLQSATKPLPSGAVAALAALGHSMPKGGLEAIRPGATPVDLHKALVGFYESLKAAGNAGIQMVADADAVMPAQAILTRTAVESLPTDAKRAILDLLETDDGRNLVAFYDSQAMNSPDAAHLASDIGLLVQQLKTSLGRPNPDEFFARPANFDPVRLPPSVIGHFSMEGMVNGAGSKPIADLFQGFAAKAGLEGRDAVRLFQSLVNERAKALQVTNLPVQLGVNLVRTNAQGFKVFDPDIKDTSFEKDVARNVQVALPGGKRITRENLSEARDLLMEFVTGVPGAKFATASRVDKTKVHVLMASMNQSVAGVAGGAVNETLDTRNWTMAYETSGPVKAGNFNFTLSKDPATGDVTIQGSVRKDFRGFVVFSGSGEPTAAGKGSFERTDFTVKFPAANLDTLGKAAWAIYDHDIVNAADRNPARPRECHEDAAKLVPPPFRFTGTVEVHRDVVVNAAPPGASPFADANDD